MIPGVLSILPGLLAISLGLWLSVVGLVHWFFGEPGLTRFTGAVLLGAICVMIMAFIAPAFLVPAALLFGWRVKRALAG